MLTPLAEEAPSRPLRILRVLCVEVSFYWGESMAGHNPRTVEEARAFVAHVESLFMPWNIDGLLAGFTEDCVVKFGDLPWMTREQWSARRGVLSATSRSR